MSSKDTPYFPLFVNLLNQNVIVFGGGKIACRRIQTLLDFGSFITVIAPKINGDLQNLMDEGKIKVIEKVYENGDCKGANMVLAATNDRNVNRNIYIECRKQNICVNVADCKEECSFYFPAIVKKDSLVVGITASGKNHKLVKDFAEKIRNLIH